MDMAGQGAHAVIIIMLAILLILAVFSRWRP
jgi:hypothetical protein